MRWDNKKRVPRAHSMTRFESKRETVASTSPCSRLSTAFISLWGPVLKADSFFTSDRCIQSQTARRYRSAASQVRFGHSEPRCANESDLDVSHAAINPGMVLKPDLKSDLRAALSIADRQIRAESIKRIILELEGMPNARPGTAEFADFALSGTWELLFSSSPSSSSSQIRLRQLVQSFDATEKTITNTCSWTYIGDGTVPKVEAVIEIGGKYSFRSESPLLDVEVQSHQIRVVEGRNGQENGALPEDLRSVVMDLQRSLPIEFFDPSGTVEISHLDPTFRISCMVGKRLNGVRNVFQRLRFHGFE
jgi:hypothetical protein